MLKKKTVMRMCTGCGEMKPKKELMRIVKAPDVKDEEGNVLEKGTISLDITGKKNGRGAYICKNAECLKSVKKSKKLEKTFMCRISDDIYESIEEEIRTLEE